MAECKFTKPDGKNCQAHAVTDSDFCFTHDPELQEEKLVAVTRGGLNRKLFKKYGDWVDIKHPKDIRKLVAETLNLVRTGIMPANQPANTIGFLSKIWLDAHEATEVEVRIDNLEEKLEKTSEKRKYQ